MTTSVSNVEEWKLDAVKPLLGIVSGASNSVIGLGDSLVSIITIAAQITEVAAKFVTSIDDPALLALKSATTAVESLLKSFDVGVSGTMSLLLLPPVFGHAESFSKVLARKLKDKKDPGAPTNDANNAGIIVWGEIVAPNSAMALFDAIYKTFSPRAAGTSTKPPKRGLVAPKVSSRGVVRNSNVVISWDFPHPFVIEQGLLALLDSEGAEFSKVIGIRNVSIYRKLFGESSFTKVGAVSPPITTYTDTTLTTSSRSAGPVDYYLDVEFQLLSGDFISSISNTIRIPTSKLSNKNPSTFGSEPAFYSMKASIPIAGISSIPSEISSFLNIVTGLSTNFGNELTKVAEFTKRAAAQIKALLTKLRNLVTSVVTNLEVIANSGLKFVQYAGNPSTAVAQVIAGSSTSEAAQVFRTGILLNVGSPTIAAANAIIGSIGGLIGLGATMKPLAESIVSSASALADTLGNATI